MLSEKYSVLIIDDHPIIVNAYETALQKYSSENEDVLFSVTSASNCNAALEAINNYVSSKKKLDIVFLDIRLPKSEDGKFISGEDIGIKIKAVLPETKIIISTTLNDNYRLHSLLKSVDPDGFLIKNDVTPYELIRAIDAILKGLEYYSKTVLSLLRKQISNEFVLDDIDRKMLHEISLGTKMKDFPKILPLSIAGIEKRKRRLRELFDVKTSSDRELLQLARDKGFI
jgi:DNA-binding NarL/FixJ family response regulator